MEGHGRSWTVMDGHGRPRKAMEGHGRGDHERKHTRGVQRGRCGRSIPIVIVIRIDGAYLLPYLSVSRGGGPALGDVFE